MKGFFGDNVIKSQEGDQPWDPFEDDRLIELHLMGTIADRIAIKLKRTPKAIRRRLEQFTYNERDMTSTYKPNKRTSRKGKRVTENERVLLQAWRERAVPQKSQARFLQRELSELGIQGDELSKLVDMRKVGTGVDLILAYRYLYYCKGISIVTDVAYDTLEKEEIEFGACGHILKQAPSSDRPEDYPPHVRALAMYLAFKWTEREASNGDAK